MIQGLWHDVRYAAQQLARARAFALTAVATLALGVGANTGLFSLINAFLRPLSVPAADRLVVLAAQMPGDTTGFRYRFSYPALVDYRAQATVFSDLVAWDMRISAMTFEGKTERFLHAAVTGDFFTGLGLSPAAGRLLRPGEGERTGTDSLVILGHGYWRERFGGRLDVIGATVRVNGTPAKIIGIAPEGFRGVYEGLEMDGYVPLGGFGSVGVAPESRFFDDRAFAYLTLIARLRPDVTLREAQAALNVVADRIAHDHPATEASVGVRLVPETLARPIPVAFVANTLPIARSLLLVLTGLVLLLACINVTNLLLVRATIRQRELAVRSALGASRTTLARLLLIESGILALAGAAIGLIIGQGLSHLLMGSLGIASDIPITLGTHFDWRVFGYAAGIAVFTGVAVGLVPAFRASRVQISDLLHDGDRAGSAGGKRTRLRHGLVVLQIAGSVVLLVVAGFFVRSLRRADQIDYGFDPRHLYTFMLAPEQVGYDRARSERFFDALERRIRAMSGVEQAAQAASVPMGYGFHSCPIEAEGAEATDDRHRQAAQYNSVGTEYFTTMRLPVLRGRAIDQHDIAASTPVAVVNATMAARLWPGRDAIGKRLRIDCGGDPTLWTVVGVAGDSKYVVPFEPPLPYAYVPIAQTQPTFRALVVRSTTPTPELVTRLRREIAALDPEVPIFNSHTMEDAIAGGPGAVMFRTAATQGALMGVLGLALAVIGLYGVVSYAVSQREREFGIRIALGANPGDVRRLVLRQGIRLVAAGLACGLVLSTAATFFLTRFVVVGRFDIVPMVWVAIGLAVIALIACYLPARRATLIDPVAALRAE